MYLKTLEIQGFKSFPERTLIEFHPGITAIVGPNGSGKSNVADAIRWVLGEQSVRTLRGGKMEDVIFSGTESRRAMSFAEVSIVIDNSDGKMPVEYTEFQVTRRLYRSGESEYLINRTPCRLRDISQLFMDTGLGRDGYSIVGQGRVDEILSNRSEDRRRVFEEASGIVKFKSRKDEAERKLLTCEQNLLRVQDLAQELQSRLDPLREQAAAARLHAERSEELRRLEVALILEGVTQQTEKLQEARQETELLRADLLASESDVEQIRSDHRSAGEALQALDNQAESNRLEWIERTDEAAELRGRDALLEERRLQIDRREGELGREIAELSAGIDQLKADRQSRQSRMDALQSQRTQYAGRLSEAESSMNELLATLGDAERQAEERRNSLDHLAEEIFTRRDELAQLRASSTMLEQRARVLEEEERAAIQDSDRHRLLQEGCAEDLRGILGELGLKQADRDRARQTLDEHRAICNTLAAEAENARRESRQATFRRDTLLDLDKRHEGYSEAIRSLMADVAGDPDLRSRVPGTVGSLIRTEKTDEVAIETALGPAIQNLITDGQATAAGLIEKLKSSRAGRATFLPLDVLEIRPLDPSTLRTLAAMPGYVDTADALVRSDDDRIRPAIRFLLGRTVVVDTLDHALAMSRAIRQSCRLVTREGELLNPGGSISGGRYRQEGPGLLGRRREIDRLAQDIQEWDEQAVHKDSERTAAEQVLRAADRTLAGLEQELLDLTHARLRAEARLTATEQEIARIASRRASLKEERQQQQRQTADHQQAVDTLEAIVKDLDDRSAREKNALSDLESRHRAEQSRRDDLREQITEWRVSLQSFDESLRDAQDMINRLTEDSTERANHLARLHQEQQRQSDDRRTIAEDRLQLSAKTDELRIRMDLLQRDRLAFGEERKAIEARQAAFFDRLEQAAARLASLQTEIARAEGKAARFEAAIDESRNRLWETYELTVGQLDHWPALPKNRAESTRRVAELKAELREIGPVNPGAIAEFDAVSARAAFIQTQHDDIAAARDRLNGVIADLTAAMREQFLAQFALINANFAQVFSELFGGGIAELSLEEGQDALSCGIEIQAQPPGKRLQNLMLLSGGERCLTAIALLFAILNLRPTPFSVLDEVEAALDDANVVRFNAYIRRYADESQFIVVTHRKGTMEAADRIYGVTMQERGISRILSMRVADAPEEAGHGIV